MEIMENARQLPIFGIGERILYIVCWPYANPTHSMHFGRVYVETGVQLNIERLTHTLERPSAHYNMGKCCHEQIYGPLT
jgi:hypothetical protein